MAINCEIVRITIIPRVSAGVAIHTSPALSPEERAHFLRNGLRKQAKTRVGAEIQKLLDAFGAIRMDLGTSVIVPVNDCSGIDPMIKNSTDATTI